MAHARRASDHYDRIFLNRLVLSRSDAVALCEVIEALLRGRSRKLNAWHLAALEKLLHGLHDAGT